MSRVRAPPRITEASFYIARVSARDFPLHERNTGSDCPSLSLSLSFRLFPTILSFSSLHTLLLRYLANARIRIKCAGFSRPFGWYVRVCVCTCVYVCMYIYVCEYTCAYVRGGESPFGIEKEGKSARRECEGDERDRATDKTPNAARPRLIPQAYTHPLVFSLSTPTTHPPGRHPPSSSSLPPSYSLLTPHPSPLCDPVGPFSFRCPPL